MRATPIVALALAALAACRDGTLPFSARDREPGPEASPWRLTFNPGDDRSPAWSPGGDSVYYMAQGFDPLPDAPGVIVAVPREGGALSRVLSGVQEGAAQGQWLATPAAAPDGERLAYTEVAPLHPDRLCPDAPVSCEPPRADVPRLPPLRQAILRVRRFDAVAPPASDPSLSVHFAGVELDTTRHPGFAEGVYIIHFFPFQMLFDLERAFVFRPSWSPDGQRIAFSDGLALRIWTVGDSLAPSVPGVEDAVSAAWSPDGEWIAFTRVERADSTGATCVHEALVPCVEERTEYLLGRRILSLIRPDGTDLQELGEGEEPAWSPDGSALFFRRDDGLWRLDRATGDAAPLPGTSAGREPAPSPDGRFLAFARRTATGNYDLWVLELPRSP